MNERILILFDIDGTLVDTAGAGRRALLGAFHELFRIDGLLERARDLRFAGMTDWTIFSSLARLADIDDDWHGETMERLREGYLRHLDTEMGRDDDRRRVLPGIRERLDELSADARTHLGLITGNLEPGARTKLEPFDLNRYFASGGFGSDHPERREVAAAAVRRMSRIAGVDFAPDRVVVIGDTANDVDCARANGYRSVAVRSGFGSEASLRAAEPDFLLDDLGDREEAHVAFGLA